MAAEEMSGGTVHKMPADLKKAVAATPEARAAWESLTPLARNEWICWSITVKQPQTRNNHIGRTTTELQEGKRRPCCWAGCTHRTPASLKDRVFIPRVGSDKTGRWASREQ
jgi:hypothetical protein